MEGAIIYNRVSTTEQNPELQIKECEEYCEKKNWQVIDVLQEQASAYKDESKRDKFNDMIARAEKGDFKHIVVWNMDRFSRQPEEEVLKLVKKLHLIHGVDINAVRGDVWSDLVQSVTKIKEQGFIGEAISDFLEKIIRGLEFQRTHRESKIKSERVKLAIRKEDGITKSYKGNKWGRKEIISPRLKERIIELKNQGLSLRNIIKQEDVYYYDRNKNKVKPSIQTVWEFVKGAQQEKGIKIEVKKPVEKKEIIQLRAIRKPTINNFFHRRKSV
jgi:DNA invertase Pin-like site-specific DNA recombinase